MAIYVPGRRDRHNRPLRKGGRSVVAMLSLTAMVDMFTVLAVFLLQNYNVTGEVLDIEDNVQLPQASAVKELKPAYVVVLSKQNLMLDKDIIASFVQVKEQQDWRIEPLFVRLKTKFQDAQTRAQSGVGAIRQAVQSTKPGDTQVKPEDDRRVTVQVDKAIDFLTVKKVMATLTEAGASEINFAVMKEEKAPN